MKQATLQFKTLILLAAFFIYGIFQVRQALVIFFGNKDVSEVVRKAKLNAKSNLNPRGNTNEYTLAVSDKAVCFLSNERQHNAFGKQTFIKHPAYSFLKGESKALPYDWSIFSALMLFEYSSR